MLLAVALPAIILAHLLGLVLLLYSLEKVSGVVSRTWKRVRGIPLDVEQRGGTHDGGALAASPMKAAVAGVKSKGWVRGCACTVSSGGREGRGLSHAAGGGEPCDAGFGGRALPLPSLPTRATTLVECARPLACACAGKGGKWARPAGQAGRQSCPLAAAPPRQPPGGRRFAVCFGRDRRVSPRRRGQVTRWLGRE